MGAGGLTPETGAAYGVRRPPGWLPGPAPSWSALSPDERRGIGLREVRVALARGREVVAGVAPAQVTPVELPPSGGGPRPAAVLCLLFQSAGEAHVVLTRRSSHLRSHAGEVSFPGGRLDRGEAPLEAALREAREEIGLNTSSVELIGWLTPLTTARSDALVHCVVGSFPGPGEGGLVLSPQVSEVDRVFFAPLSGLMGAGVFHEELWPAEPGAEGTQYRAVPFFDFAGEVIWGATGRLLVELLGRAVAARRRRRPVER